MDATTHLVTTKELTIDGSPIPAETTVGVVRHSIDLDRLINGVRNGAIEPREEVKHDDTTGTTGEDRPSPPPAPPTVPIDQA